MLTKNWYNHTAAALTGVTITGGLKDYKGTTRDAVYQTAGSASYLNFNKLSPFYAVNKGSLITTKSDNVGYMFGDNATPASMDDYTVVGNIVTGITVSKTVTGSADDSGVSLTTIFTIANENDTDITIAEVCLFNKCDIANASQVCCCIDRTVLDSPITIMPDHAGQITYTVRMNYPMA